MYFISDVNTKHGTAFLFLKYPRSSILFTVLKVERTKTENKGTNQRLEVPSTEASTIDAICINCNKRFKTMHAVSMHLRVTARRTAYVLDIRICAAYVLLCEGIAEFEVGD